MKDISYMALLAAFLIMTVPLRLSYKQQLGISKDIIIASIRAASDNWLYPYIRFFD
ncbi:hypothetical protein [Domibacillus aminovorans]|uniref:hypothetical protein n=1 Tax=Domibacillus aminovorans TaxID=29332 RepID=UPI0012FE19C5|nr:hypothetical protein [Domibacillus aminovorans]